MDVPSDENIRAWIAQFDDTCNSTAPSNLGDPDFKKKSWVELREDVRNIRRRLWGVASRLPSSFVYRKSSASPNSKSRVYFMSSSSRNKENSVFAIDVPACAPPITEDKPPRVMYPWLQVLSSGFQSTYPNSKEEQLLMERKRMAISGIASFDFHVDSAKFVFTAASSIYECVDTNSAAPLTPTLIHTPLSIGTRLNVEMCPYNPDLIAYVNNGDIFVVNSTSGCERQLTHTFSMPGVGAKYAFSAGYPSYIMQEEFNRFHGFWWQPVATDGIYRILYEEVDESDVQEVSLLSLPGREREEYRFPTPGSPNAKSTLRIIEFDVINGDILNAAVYDFKYSIKDYFDWTEYVVRAGWTPNGKHIWAQILDRKQQRLELVLFPVFTPKSIENGALATGFPSAPAYVIYSESTDVWINVHDILKFLPCQEPDTVEFLWASEETGFRHIYRIKSSLRACISEDWFYETHGVPVIHLSPLVLCKEQLTRGDWEVINDPIAINHDLEVFFFLGLKDSPIERHLYVTSFQIYSNPIRLTKPGYSYSVEINADATLAILTFSSTTTPPVCQLCRINYKTVQGRIRKHILDQCLEPLTYFNAPAAVDPVFAPPEICSYNLENGEKLYAMIYKPANFDPSKKYPTVLNVYGGPEVQLVYNSFKGIGQLWLYLLTAQGFCVVAIDSRGSRHRGLKFESHIKYRLGTVELKDQVEILGLIIKDNPFIDPGRVGIYGWSYGGYLSLMALAKYPHVFKVAVAGAPVTSWDLYDTGYTERYMGLPLSNYNAYQQSSVLSYIHNFPDQEDRLLIIHGLVDENVHFIHTAQLVNALVKAGKPHIVQIYPNERHSLRRLDTSEHYETLLLSFLQRCLK